MAVAPEALDLMGVLRASRAISSEIDPSRLLDRALRLIVENAGAQRGTLMTREDGKLRITAAFDVRTGSIEVFDEADVEGSGLVPETVVRFVARSGDDVVLADAGREGPFARDPYVTAHESKSIVCIPVRHQERMTGVLLLENEVSRGAFTWRRVEILRLLIAQAAVSLENARLYGSTRALNRALEESEARASGVLEGLPVGVLVLERDARVSYVNRDAREILGVPESEDAGERILEGIEAFVAGTNESYPEERWPASRALHGESSMVDDVEIVVGDRAGAERRVPLAVWGKPIFGERGEVDLAVVALRDITTERAAERQRARLEDQLARAERLEAVGRLAGGVAHDFNNLLMPMLVYSDLALKEVPRDSPVHEQLRDVRDAAQRAADLTRQLLAFGRQEPLEPRILDLDEEVAELLRMVRRIFPENIVIRHRPCDDPCVVQADRSQLHRILMNLAMNAADAMPSGGELTIETRIVEVPPGSRQWPRAPAGRYVGLRVKDTGCGMDEETIQKVFDPFFTTKEVGKGTGLGLPTAYGLVAEHGGYMHVQSEVGRGATFDVLLPLATQDTSMDEDAPPDIVMPAMDGPELASRSRD